ncbi:hypothetical protein [Acidovorax sp.]|uniref:hypothetical protein n=1 Tax=Acidovorax sp. TaxID=1872122 RepID=UPI0031E3A0DA
MRTLPSHRPSPVFRAVSFLLVLCAPLAAGAATRVVTSTSDNPALAGTLPYWLLNAADGDTIDCTPIAGQQIALTASLPATVRSYTLIGAGITIDGAGAHQAFQVAAGNMVIGNVTVHNAMSKGGDGGTGTRAAAVGWGAAARCMCTAALR